jgi:hypothetical protein
MTNPIEIKPSSLERDFQTKCKLLLSNQEEEIDALKTLDGPSPLRVTLAIENLNILYKEVEVVQKLGLDMINLEPNCRTVVGNRNYHGKCTKFASKTDRLRRVILILRDVMVSWPSRRNFCFNWLMTWLKLRNFESLNRNQWVSDTFFFSFQTYIDM